MTPQEFIQRVAEMRRYDVEICNCHLGPHTTQVRADKSGEYVQWDHVQELLDMVEPDPVEALRAEFDNREDGRWGEHPKFTFGDWCYEAGAGDTRIGYWDWVLHQMEWAEENEEDPEC